MRSLPVLLVVGLLSAGAGACGGAGKSASAASHASSNAVATGGAAASAASGASSVATRPMLPQPPVERSTRGFLNDDDGDLGGARENRGYHDPDDPSILAYYGRPANATTRRAVAALAKRYYALAAADDGPGACAMILPSTVKAVPLDYGLGGQPYLHSAKTCQEVLVRLFKHHRRELSTPPAVTGVLVKGDHAYALLGSRKMRASFITLMRWHGAWWIEAVLGGRII